jgi:hypothetical protein
MKYLSDMIDVRELRIGNLITGIYTEEVYNETTEEYDEIERRNLCKVLALSSTENDYPIWVECIDKSEAIEYDRFEGIPLTEEWLVKFGFVYSEIKQSFGISCASGLRLSLIDDGVIHVYIGNYPITIQFVHQFMNLFHILTGDELTLI